MAELGMATIQTRTGHHPDSDQTPAELRTATVQSWTRLWLNLEWPPSRLGPATIQTRTRLQLNSEQSPSRVGPADIQTRIRPRPDSDQPVVQSVKTIKSTDASGFLSLYPCRNPQWTHTGPHPNPTSSETHCFCTPPSYP